MTLAFTLMGNKINLLTERAKHRDSEGMEILAFHVIHAALPLIRQQPLKRHRREVVVAPGVTQPRTTPAAQRRPKKMRGMPNAGCSAFTFFARR